MRRFNNRPILFLFLAFGLGIIFARPIFALNGFAIIFCSLAFVGIFVLCLKHKCMDRLVCVSVGVVVGVCAYFVAYNCFGGTSYESESIVVGRAGVVTYYEGSQSLVLDNVFVDGKRISSNVKIFIYDDNDISVGDAVSFSGRLNNVGLYNFGEFNSYDYKNNIAYECNLNADDIEVTSTGNLTWAEVVRNSVWTLINKNMNETEAGICYASLFGDKSYIPHGAKEAFSAVGVAHILAISGLHVGVIVMLLSAILYRLKAKKGIKVAIIASFLAVYCYLCSFSPSVVRASIMFFILSLADILGENYDRLNAWSIAGLLILMVSPLSIFDAGFLLSFACVLCIILFSSSISHVLEGWHLPEWLSGSLSIMLAVQLGMAPLTLYLFKSVSLLSLIANFLIVPLFEFAFVTLILFSMASFIIPPMSGILTVPMYLVSFVTLITKFLASSTWLIVTVGAISSLLVMCIYAGMFISSHLVNVSGRQKLISACSIIMVGILLAVFSNLSASPKSGTVSVIEAYGNSVYAIDINDKTFVVGSFNRALIDEARTYLDSTNRYKADYYISFTANVPSNDKYFKNVYSIEEADVANGMEIGQTYNFDGITAEVVKLNQRLAGVMIYISDFCVLVCASNSFTNSLCREFMEEHSNIDLIVGNNSDVAQFSGWGSCYSLVDGAKLLKDEKIIADMTGDWRFTLGKEKILNIRSLD